MNKPKGNNKPTNTHKTDLTANAGKDIANILSSETDTTNNDILTTCIDKNSEARNRVNKNTDRESCAWNITGSMKMDDNLEILEFFAWIKKIGFYIAMHFDIQLPDFDTEDYKQEFANRCTSLGDKNIGNILDICIKKYKALFDKKYNDRLSDDFHKYQFIKIINSTLQKTQMFKHGLDPALFRLSDDELIREINKAHGKPPLIVGSDQKPEDIAKEVINYIQLTEDAKNNLN